MKKPTADVLKEAREKLGELMEKRNAARDTASTLAEKLTDPAWDEAKDGPALELAQRNLTNIQKALDLQADKLASYAKDSELEQRMLDLGGAAPDAGVTPGVSVTPGKLPDSMKDSPENARKNFRLLRALSSTINRSGNLDGLEKEMNDEGLREFRSMGMTAVDDDLGSERYRLVLPSFLMGNGRSAIAAQQEAGYRERRGLQQRDYLAETTTAGGHLIQTDVGQLIPVLEPRLQVEALGATMLRGLTGNLDLPRNNAYSTATWEGETDDAAETQSTFDKVSLSPERLAAYSQVSRQNIIQAKNVDLENFVRRALNTAVRRGLDLAAINGSGSGDQPTGILNTASVNDITIGTDGGPLDWATIVSFETALANDDADEGTLAFLTTPGVAGFLKTLKRDVAGNGFIWEGPNNGKGMVNGYSARTSNQVPSTLSKGSSGSILHAMIFANWRELVIAQWGGVDLIVDPYTLAKKGMVELTINSYWDIALMHLASFCICNEIDIS